jgi:hypothetical protein
MEQQFTGKTRSEKVEGAILPVTREWQSRSVVKSLSKFTIATLESVVAAAANVKRQLDQDGGHLCNGRTTQVVHYPGN